MSKYIMEFDKTQATALLEYNERGWLVSYKFEPGAFSDEIFRVFARGFPCTIELLGAWQSTKAIRIKEVPFDASFEAFWTAYAMKVGNKPRCIKLWEAMTEPNQIKAIKFIPQYNTYLAQNNINKKLPETFLNQEPWNN